MPDLLPGTEVAARGLRWELVYTQNLGSQALHLLRGLQAGFAGQEIDLLSPFSRAQYAHVLSTFSHSSYKDAPRQCLAVFDELQKIGLEAFTKKHDLYWDIPLNQNLPQPVIDLPIPPTALKQDAAPYRTGELFDFQTPAAPPGSGCLFAEKPVTRKRKKGAKQ